MLMVNIFLKVQCTNMNRHQIDVMGHGWLICQAGSKRIDVIIFVCLHARKWIGY